MVQRKQYIVVFLVLFLLLGVFLFYPINEMNRKQADDTDGKTRPMKVQDENKYQEEIDGVKKKQRNADKKISFDRYKHIYESASKEDVLVSHLSSGSKECKKTYAVLELIFLRQNQKGDYEPINVTGFSYQSLNDQCMRDKMGIGIQTNFLHHLRIRKNDCECFAQLRAGRKYLLTKIGFYEDGNKKIIKNLKYKIKIPPKKELNFISNFDGIEGTKEDQVYRYPVVLEDLMSAQHEARRKQKPSVNVRVTGLKKKYKDTSIILYYYRDQVIYDTIQASSNAEINIHGTDESGVVEDDIAVYEVWRSGPKNRISKMKLRQYLKNIPSTEVNLSKDVNFDYEDRDWIKETIDLRPIFDQYIRKHPEKEQFLESNKDEPVGLMMGTENFNTKKTTGVMIFTTSAQARGEQMTVQLSAPPGSYHLVLGDVVLTKDYQWPPKD